MRILVLLLVLILGGCLGDPVAPPDRCVPEISDSTMAAVYDQSGNVVDSVLVMYGACIDTIWLPYRLPRISAIDWR